MVSGTPSLTTAATSTSPVGTHPITVAVGSLSATNYSFTPVSGGTVNIVTPLAQTITFPAISTAKYGAAPIALTASSSSGLAVAYTVTGPASISGKVLTILGAGAVAVTATQVGNNVYGAATVVVQQFTVVPAVLTITANNATRDNNTQNPAFTYGIGGLVNGDTASTALSGTPALTTTATVSSPVGTYPITPAIGTLNAANYTFTFVPGTLTITAGGLVSSFSIAASPQSLTVGAGQIMQSVITLTSVNYYIGLVGFKCNNLPANVSCTFSPPNLAPDGTNTPVSTTPTINTNSASPVVGVLKPKNPTNGTAQASLLWLPQSSRV